MKINKIHITLIFTFSFIMLYIYGIFEYTNIKIKTIVLESKEIPKSFDNKTVIFVSDFQYDTKTHFNIKALKKAINKINEEEKDILLIGGDFTNWSGKIPKFYEEFSNIKIPKYGAYTILGNHDYDYVDGINENIKYLNNIGINVLEDSNEKININNENIYISGTNDYWSGKLSKETALENLDKKDFVLFLTHNPEYYIEYLDDNDRENIDLSLSGHTHGGQISFFGLFAVIPIKMQYWISYRYGMKNINGNKMYITSGLGGSVFGKYIRIFARPEIVKIILKKKD